MISRRRCAKPTWPRSWTHFPSPSGPRWASRRFINSSRGVSAPTGFESRLSMTPIPHMADPLQGAASLAAPILRHARRPPRDPDLGPLPRLEAPRRLPPPRGGVLEPRLGRHLRHRRDQHAVAAAGGLPLRLSGARGGEPARARPRAAGELRADDADAPGEPPPRRREPALDAVVRALCGRAARA